MPNNSVTKEMVVALLAAICFAVLWFLHGVQTAVVEMLAVASILWLWHTLKEPLYRTIMIFAAVVLFCVSILTVSYTMSLALVTVALLFIFTD